MQFVTVTLYVEQLYS